MIRVYRESRTFIEGFPICAVTCWSWQLLIAWVLVRWMRDFSQDRNHAD